MLPIGYGRLSLDHFGFHISQTGWFSIVSFVVNVMQILFYCVHLRHLLYAIEKDQNGRLQLVFLSTGMLELRSILNSDNLKFEFGLVHYG